MSLALLLTRLYAPLTALANARVEVATALVSFERVFEVLDLVPLIRERPGAIAVPDARGHGGVTVEFDDVRFSYPAADKVSLASLEEVAELDERGGDEVLHGVSFTAQPGQMVALVGSSGAGKSTMAALLARLYDVDSGAVRLNGVDLRDLTFASLKDTVGMVTQDGHLFHESIRSNLLLAAPGATDDELWDGAGARPARRRRRRHARRSGHRRRRAWLPAVRRAAAAVDDRPPAVGVARGWWCSMRRRRRWTRQSEAAVQQALAEALAGRTSIVIAHRLSTVRSADVILVIEDGRIVERGTHEQLLARGGRYAELYRTQFGTEPVAA